MNNNNNNNINNNIIYEGKVIQKGLFFSINTYQCEKTNFVKNFLYTQILPNDTILYTLLENGYVNITKIKYRKPFYTIAIFKNIDPNNIDEHALILPHK
jgi:hypothetical protein